MKTLNIISAIMVLAGAFLSSCTLLESSPLHPSGPPRHSGPPVHSLAERIPAKIDAFVPLEIVNIIIEDAYEAEINSYYPSTVFKDEIYSEIFPVPVEGGSYEFELNNDYFLIAKVFDSNMPRPRSSLTTRSFRPVNADNYNGSFYNITCNQDDYTWKIEVAPMHITDKHMSRTIYVEISPILDDYKFVFQFTQSNYGFAERNPNFVYYDCFDHIE